METLHIEKTDTTPLIHFDSQTGIMTIRGRSVTENPLSFYAPVVKWLEEYKNYPKQKVVLEVQLEYFNTSSSKCLLDVFKKFAAISRSGTPVEVNWWCEEVDDEMREAGEDYQDLVGLPFNILTIS
ncbi:MAG: DUF1987 domain-containing protein [Cytophagales bacterium]|nr:DUF1987 domain-containing protein [Cytophagales bacterium]MDW8383696.1 DUF1987 domain-containing protein [Flammeovirgaceae bacterium]